MPDDILQRVYSKADKIRELPPEIRDKVLDALYMRIIDKKLPKAIDEGQREEIKFRFKQNALGIQRQPIPEEGISEANYKKSGLPTGMKGRFESGVMSGLANVTEFSNKILPHNAAFGVPEKYQPQLKEGIAKERDVAKVLHEASSAYSERHPTKANISEISGQALPGVPYGMVAGAGIPAAAGLGLAGRLGVNALRGGAAGAVENTAFDPTASGVAKGGAFGAAGSIPFTLGGAMLKRLFGKGASAISTASTETIPGASDDSASVLDKIAQEKFGQSLTKLTPAQKTEAVQEWMSQIQKGKETARAEAVKIADAKKAEKLASKTEARVKTARDKITSQVETRRAMDEAKGLQKRIAGFIKANKRAPTDEELTTLRAAKDEAAMPEMKAPVPIQPPAKQDVSDFRKMVLAPMLKKQLAEAGTDEERKIIGQQLAVAEAPLPEAFKVESPEVMAAVQSVADTSKALGPTVTKIPEGVAGTGGGAEASALERRAKEALRKANARQAGMEAHVAEAAQAEVKTPETALLDKEEEFLQRIETLEALGPKGKEAAKNLNKFVKNGTIKMDDAFGMIDKVLEKLKGGAQ